jgi:hypothetical protein
MYKLVIVMCLLLGYSFISDVSASNQDIRLDVNDMESLSKNCPSGRVVFVGSLFDISVGQWEMFMNSIRYSSILSLDFRQVGMGDEKAKIVLSNLPNSLENLVLSDNYMGVDIIRFPLMPLSLVNLTLSHNMIRDESASSLIKSLPSTIKTINFDCTGIKNEAIVCLSQKMSYFTDLKHISLRGNNIDDVALLPLLKSVSGRYISVAFDNKLIVNEKLYDYIQTLMNASAVFGQDILLNELEPLILSVYEDKITALLQENKLLRNYQAL